MKELIPLGVILIFIGMALVFIGALSQANNSNSETKVAIGGMIGFIPFGFWNDKKLRPLVIGFIVISICLWAISFIFGPKS